MAATRALASASLAWIAAAALQGGPARWVATHRRHHQTADYEGDPHSPVGSFFYGHVGWIMRCLAGIFWLWDGWLAEEASAIHA